MNRVGGVAMGMWSVALAAASAPAAGAIESPDRPLYVESVLYRGETVEPALFLAAADSGDLVPPSPHPTAIDESAADFPADTTRVPNPAAGMSELRQPSIAIPLASSALLGGALGYGGWWGGILLSGENDVSGEDWATLGAAVTGAFVGEVLGVTLGAHLGNGSRGSFGKDLLVSFLGGLMTSGAAAFGGIPGAIVGYGAQVYFTVRTERDEAAAEASSAR